MEPRFQRRKEQLLAACQVPPTLFRGVMSRLEAFAQPFIAALPSPESRAHSRTYIAGLLSDAERKNAESIAYRYDLDRQVIQRFIGEVAWDHDPLIDELNRQVVAAIGRPDAVLVFDPSAFPKKGNASVGVQRPWCGRLGKVDNCQIGVYLGYVSDDEYARVDFRLYLPREWAKDRKRRKKAGIPKEVRYRTRHVLALEMLKRRGKALPHGWVAGDDERGRPVWFRKRLAADKERYLLAVPSNTSIRDLEATPPPYGGTVADPRSPSAGSAPGARRCRPGRGRSGRFATARRGRWKSRSSPAASSRRSTAGSSGSRRRWWSFVTRMAVCSSMTTTSPMPRVTRRCRSSRG
jgi:SRSO17 transposase